MNGLTFRMFNLVSFNFDTDSRVRQCFSILFESKTQGLDAIISRECFTRALDKGLFRLTMNILTMTPLNTHAWRIIRPLSTPLLRLRPYHLHNIH